MRDFTIGVTIDQPYPAAVERVRALLQDAGFGVLTEIDLKATLAGKLGVDVAPRVILGACRPQLAHQAVLADPRIATLLPCNVVIGVADDGRTRIDAFDPAVMTSLVDSTELTAIVDDARARLVGVIAELAGPDGGSDAASA